MKAEQVTGVQHLTTDNFDQTINNGITLVDFWAEWCMPCRMQGPIIDNLAKSIGTKAVIAKLDVDHNPEVAMRYGITGIPSLIIYKDGEVAKQFVGLQSEEVLKQAIEKLSVN
ncbi:MAG: thioredoxin [Spirochaetales bacterium]|nr:thioredoxin [Spirochaetales bacterium]